jgi:hypothetical protein
MSEAECRLSATTCSFMADLLKGANGTHGSPHNQPAEERSESPWDKPESF